MKDNPIHCILMSARKEAQPINNIQVINWGGDPETRIKFDQDMKTYHPRYSFKLWQEQVHNVSKPWKAGELQVAENLRNFLFEFVNADRL